MVRKLVTLLVVSASALLLSPATAWASLEWHVETPVNPSPATSASLDDVSCISNDFCMAVGVTVNGSQRAGLAEEYVNNNWVLSPLPTVPESYSLAGVSCTAANACTAVGGTTPAGGTATAMAFRWNGTTWSRQTVPPVIGSSFAQLVDVSCVAGFDWCMAVGSTTHGALAMRWNGTAWAQTTIPGTGSGDQLYSVSCTQRGACTAVGRTSNQRSLIERWSGAGVWTAQTPASDLDILKGVSCVSANFCVGVGYRYGFPLDPQIDIWNGGTWSSSATGKNFITADVSCATAAYCMAVGWSTTEPVKPLAYGWDGNTWVPTTVPVPDSHSSAFFLGVTCPSVELCRATGSWYHHDDYNDVWPLAERWS
jgi:hypothetical protein